MFESEDAHQAKEYLEYTFSKSCVNCGLYREGECHYFVNTTFPTDDKHICRHWTQHVIITA